MKVVHSSDERELKLNVTAGDLGLNNVKFSRSPL